MFKFKGNNSILDERTKLQVRSLMVLSLCVVLLVLAGLVGSSLGWYQTSKESGAQNTVSSAKGTDAPLAVGHNTYKYRFVDPENSTAGEGILIPEDTKVTMNEYDMIFKDHNNYTPIILRAVLSPEYAALAETNNLKLVVKSRCIEAVKEYAASSGTTQDVFGRVERDSSASGYDAGLDAALEDYPDVTNFLSNVVHVKADYIPGLATAAESGSYDTSAYASADDYIYRSAVAHFQSSTAAAVQFAEQTGSTPSVTETTVTYTLTEGTNLGALVAGQSVGSGREYVYFIKSGNSYLTPSGTGAQTANLNASYTFNLTSGQTDTFNATYQNYGWDVNFVGEEVRFSGHSNGNYLRRTTGGSNNNPTATLGISNSNSDNGWTVGNGATVSFTHTYYYGYRTTNFGLRLANNAWSLTNTQGSWTNVTFVRVEKRTTSSTTPGVKMYDNKVVVDVTLNNALEDDGNYYVYIMMDYDLALVGDYFVHNGMAFSIGQEGEPFEDYFYITPSTTE